MVYVAVDFAVTFGIAFIMLRVSLPKSKPHVRTLSIIPSFVEDPSSPHNTSLQTSLFQDDSAVLDNSFEELFETITQEDQFAAATIEQFAVRESKSLYKPKIDKILK
jgi:hypothetical protein